MGPLAILAISAGIQMGYSAYMGGRARKSERRAKQKLMNWIETGAFPAIDPALYTQAKQLYATERTKALEITRGRQQRELAAAGYMPTGYREAALRGMETEAAEDIAREKTGIEMKRITAEQERKGAIGQAKMGVMAGELGTAQELSGMWQGMLESAPLDLAKQLSTTAMVEYIYPKTKPTGMTGAEVREEEYTRAFENRSEEEAEYAEYTPSAPFSSYPNVPLSPAGTGYYSERGDEAVRQYLKSLELKYPVAPDTGLQWGWGRG